MSECDRSESIQWCEKASRCPQAEHGFEPYHKWFTLSVSKSNSSENVTEIMCGVCFHKIHIQDCHKHQDLMASF
jgi:hypothetical protein